MTSYSTIVIRSFTDPSFTGSIFVCGPLHHHVLLFSIIGAVGLFRSICCSFFTWFGHDFPAGQFVSVRSYLIAATTG